MFGNKFDVNGKLVVVAGGSRGLGKALALELASKGTILLLPSKRSPSTSCIVLYSGLVSSLQEPGANLLILARTEATLQDTQLEVEAACVSSKQIVDTRVVDLTNPDEITRALRHYHPPDILVCTAGGTPTQVGFLADIPPENLTSCMESNYYTTIFAVQCCLRLWLVAPQTPSPRHIILTSSTAAFLGLPGYIAYTPTKVAIRALADTLRQELLLYGKDAFRVHCCFPGTFLSESFSQGQEHKPGLTKVLEGTSMSKEDLEQKIPGAREVARKIVWGLEKGKTYIAVDFQTELLLNNMRGPSPRFWAVCDFFLGLLASFVWWIVRIDFDRKTTRYGATRNARDSRV